DENLSENDSKQCSDTSGECKQSSDCSSDEEGKTGTNTHHSDSISAIRSNDNNANCAQQKRPMNAFLIFCKRHRSVVKQKYPHLENRSVTKILGEWWAALDADQKHKYTELARQYKEAFMKANPHFKWYKTDIKVPVMQPPSPPIVPPVSLNDHVAPQSSPPQQNVQTNCTPKPPKKRYLESTEFKGSNNSTAVANTAPHSAASVPINKKNPPPVGGPPILDIDTMNRVIENALGGGSCKGSFRRSNDTQSSSSSSKHNSEKETSFRVNDNQNEDKTERSKHLTKTKSSVSSLASSSQMESTEIPDANSSNDKPLNLSSSKVLHTSNQQIIDHYIDKLLSTAPTGNPLPIEMQTSQSSQPFTMSVSKAQRKERTCKGKRYLEMLSENKLAKRNKNNSGDEQKSNSCINAGGSSSSKWVSGGFDLEEHIAALPQLGDKHLINALNHSKANKSLNGNKTSDASTTDNKQVRETDKGGIYENANETSSKKDATNRETKDSSQVNCNSDERAEKSAVVASESCVNESQTHGIDGLTALAEVALRHANRNEMSSKFSS
ncbi:SOX transcription factor-like protein, partial [Leptotrombidium deliense]